MFEIIISEIPREGEKREFKNIKIDFEDNYYDIIKANVDFCSFFIYKSGDDIKIKGKIKGSYSLVCSRCLEIFEKDFSQDVSVTFKPFYETQREGEEIELTLKEMKVNLYKGDRISILDLIKEEIYILVPLKPLCREDCKGLCPICGKNRNKEECDCQKEEFSSKFAILKTLLKEGRK